MTRVLFSPVFLHGSAGQWAALAGLCSLRCLQVVCTHGGKRHLGGELRLFNQNPALLRDEVCQLFTCVITCYFFTHRNISSATV